MTALALRAYALGLVGFSVVKILAPAFFAREDTKTPVRIALIALAVNLLLSVLLAWYLTKTGFDGPHVGLAAATSIAAMLNAFLLYRGLRREDAFRHGPGWGSLLLQVGIANAGMWLLLRWLERPVDWWLAATLSDRSGWLLVSVAGGAGAYLATLLLLGLRPSKLGMRR